MERASKPPAEDLRAQRPAGRQHPGESVNTAEATEVRAPELPEDIEPDELDPEVRRELRGLPKSLADLVAKHLVAAGQLIDTEPERAVEHARYARTKAARVALVREAAGLTAYHAGEWAEALSELRAARRMGGGPGHLAVMADCERALGRPERALELARGPEASALPAAEAIELRIVCAGARRDMRQLDAAVVALQIPELDPNRREEWSARLFYAYADNLLAVGRTDEAVRWFLNAADADDEEETDAAERAAELTESCGTPAPGRPGRAGKASHAPASVGPSGEPEEQSAKETPVEPAPEPLSEPVEELTAKAPEEPAAVPSEEAAEQSRSHED